MSQLLTVEQNVASDVIPGRVLTSKSGTLAYLAPEVYAGKGYDVRADWWSLGVLFYECIYSKVSGIHDAPSLRRRVVLGAVRCNLLACRPEILPSKAAGFHHRVSRPRRNFADFGNRGRSRATPNQHLARPSRLLNPGILSPRRPSRYHVSAPSRMLCSQTRISDWDRPGTALLATSSFNS
jgi:serine/threonine protein kinase